MAYEPKPGTFSLFKNEKKTSDNHPDYTGTGLDRDGSEIQVSAWLKDGKNGKFMSCTIKEKWVPKDKPEPKKSGGSGFDDMPDELPF